MSRCAERELAISAGVAGGAITEGVRRIPSSAIDANRHRTEAARPEVVADASAVPSNASITARQLLGRAVTECDTRERIASFVLALVSHGELISWVITVGTGEGLRDPRLAAAKTRLVLESVVEGQIVCVDEDGVSHNRHLRFMLFREYEGGDAVDDRVLNWVWKEFIG